MEKADNMLVFSNPGTGKSHLMSAIGHELIQKGYQVLFLIVPPGGSIVLGRNGDPAQNGGYVADYVYSGTNLANGADEIELVDQSNLVVDRVAYTGTAPWPAPSGRSMELQDRSADNNDGSNWSVSTTRGGSFSGTGTDLGTPGAS